MINPEYLKQEGLKLYRCVKSPGGEGVEVGDECASKDEITFKPMLRRYKESGEELPFYPITINDSYQFVELTDYHKPAMINPEYISFSDQSSRTIIFCHVYEDKVEVAYRERSTVSFGTGERFPDNVWKEIYEIVDGKLVLTKTIKGKHIPQSINVERFEWEEE